MDIADSILSCLTHRPCTLADYSWLLYDVEGSRIFDSVTQHDQYYLTRLERRILEMNADDIIERAAVDKIRRLRIVDLGAGAGVRTSILLAAAVKRQGPNVDYIPIDVSVTALSEAKTSLERLVPGVRVVPQTNNFVTEPLNLPIFDGCTLVLSIGSTISGFTLEEAKNILESVRCQLQPGDALLLGIDAQKDPAIMLNAYNDAKGAPGAFHLNLLRRLNREFGYNFNIDQFRPEIVWNEHEARVEAHLQSVCSQQVQCARREQQDIVFEKGDTIHTINAYKYTNERIHTLLSKARLEMEHIWNDEQKWYIVALCRVPKTSS